jgi:ribonucleotide monophosphatase NagD (HAD superfamily)
MALSLGMTGILTLTGATRADSLAGASVTPDFVIDSLAQLLPERSSRRQEVSQ